MVVGFGGAFFRNISCKYNGERSSVTLILMNFVVQTQ